MISPRSLLRVAASALALTTVPALAQTVEAPTGTSMPQAAPLTDTIPPPQDVRYPGTITLDVDATDIPHGIFRVKEVIPVKPGHLVLLYPKWLPGTHSPAGQINKLAGIVFTGGGKTIPWTRDPIDVFAFHLDVPAGVDTIEANFQYLSPTAANQGRTVMTPVMLNLEWIATALYPAGYYVRQIMVTPSATYPAGWTSATALRPSGTATAQGGRIQYETVAFDTLVDSPTIAGRFARIEPLSRDVTMNIIADRPDHLAAKPEHLAKFRTMVDQATKLFGAQHYNHYDFLVTLSDTLGGQGLEHHRSTEIGSPTSFFTDWDNSAAGHNVVAHEFTHSWDGKFRRPADLWTPDYRQPMGGSLLWVYEGQTQFWGNVLDARAGIVSKEEALDALASVAATYATQAGKQWRPLVDTTEDPIIARRAPAPWPNWQRSEDYYSEGQLIWVEADSIIRERSKGKRSLDDFARAFYGMRDRDWGELTYTFDDVVAALNKVEPYDWASFLHQRVDAVAPEAPLGGITRGGYKLVYTDKPGSWWKSREKSRKASDFTYSIGVTVGRDGSVSRVNWDSPAFNAGITIGTKILAVEGTAYSDDDLKQAIKDATGSKPINLLVQQGSYFRTVSIAWSGGLRYPHLEKIDPKAPSTLDALYAARK
ncbi:M61 family metallopeptidase [Sphingomonas crusticola]|uniref:M61 family metallopeptidase n=1 Tax=Sphingomonas crusticola TaxID=1697973 RepID=UPI000E278A58|nr:M61 family metallopeptidase [Sphingomonas crusticola]